MHLKNCIPVAGAEARHGDDGEGDGLGAMAACMGEGYPDLQSTRPTSLYLPTYLPTYLYTYLYLPTYLPTYLYLPTDLPTRPPTYPYLQGTGYTVHAEYGVRRKGDGVQSEEYTGRADLCHT
jgi:hypothetical protein